MAKITEDTIQICFKEWCDKQDFILAHWHIANERATSSKQGAYLKRKGVLKGCWDYWVIVNTPAIISIEFKASGGVLSKEQIEFGKVLEKANIPHKVCYSAFEATQFVKQIMEE